MTKQDAIKALLISQTRCKGSVDGESLDDFDRMPIPGGGEIPLERLIVPESETKINSKGERIHSPERRSVRETSQETKSRVNYNENESHLTKLRDKWGIINTRQFNAACVLGQQIAFKEGKCTGGYKPRMVDGGFKGNIVEDDFNGKIDADDYILSISRNMTFEYFTACRMLVSGRGASLSEIASEMQRRTIKGWSRKSSRKIKICAALDELERILPLARREARGSERMVA